MDLTVFMRKFDFRNNYKISFLFYVMANRKEALALLHEWVKSESLRQHCLGVAACMEAYAKDYILKEGDGLEILTR